MNTPFLHEWLFAHAERRPEAPAVATPSLRLSYGELAERVRALAGRLAGSGIGPGDRVMLDHYFFGFDLRFGADFGAFLRSSRS